MKILILLSVLFATQVQANWVETYREVTDPMWDYYVWDNEANHEQIPFSRDFAELTDNYGGDNFYYIYHSVSDEYIAQNNANINRILEYELTQDLSGSNKRQLSRGEARRVFRATERERVVERQDRYDPEEVLGLCFGRAIIAHIHALVRGVDESAIKKIWVLGDMEKWQFHVATILKTDRGWYVIDTYTGFMSVERWISRMERDKKRNARPLMYFVSDSERFSFQSNFIYSSVDLFATPHTELENYVENTKDLEDRDTYRGFFIDFFKSLDRRMDGIRPF